MQKHLRIWCQRCTARVFTLVTDAQLGYFPLRHLEQDIPQQAIRPNECHISTDRVVDWQTVSGKPILLSNYSDQMLQIN